MITRKTFIGLTTAVIAASGLGAFALASQGTQRADCPGKIICPQTGEIVCKDRCPLGSANPDQPVTRPCCVK